jgi:sporulation protein YlmC with PRC-barrel domain
VLKPTILSDLYPPRPIRVPHSRPNENDIDTNLRSFNEIRGYSIHALDQKFGKIENLIFDDEDNQVIYVIVSASISTFSENKLMIPVNWLSEVSYKNKEIMVDLHSETIKEAPLYREKENIDLTYEQQLYDSFMQTF